MLYALRSPLFHSLLHTPYSFSLSVFRSRLRRDCPVESFNLTGQAASLVYALRSTLFFSALHFFHSLFLMICA